LAKRWHHGEAGLGGGTVVDYTLERKKGKTVKNAGGRKLPLFRPITGGDTIKVGWRSEQGPKKRGNRNPKKKNLWATGTSTWENKESTEEISNRRLFIATQK